MLVKPNTTTVQGKVRNVNPAKDGWGTEIEIEVLENESPSMEKDFLRPSPGSIIKVFYSEKVNLHEGDIVKAKASLNAGPFGSRTVAESIDRVKARSSKK